MRECAASSDEWRSHKKYAMHAWPEDLFDEEDFGEDVLSEYREIGILEKEVWDEEGVVKLIKSLWHLIHEHSLRE